MLRCDTTNTAMTPQSQAAEKAAVELQSKGIVTTAQLNDALVAIKQSGATVVILQPKFIKRPEVFVIQFVGMRAILPGRALFEGNAHDNGFTKILRPIALAPSCWGRWLKELAKLKSSEVCEGASMLPRTRQAAF
jgi:hypothetical protein